MKIGYYLAKIWTKVCGLLFWATLYSFSPSAMQKLADLNWLHVWSRINTRSRFSHSRHWSRSDTSTCWTYAQCQDICSPSSDHSLLHDTPCMQDQPVFHGQLRALPRRAYTVWNCSATANILTHDFDSVFLSILRYHKTHVTYLTLAIFHSYSGWLSLTCV